MNREEIIKSKTKQNIADILNSGSISSYFRENEKKIDMKKFIYDLRFANRVFTADALEIFTHIQWKKQNVPA